MKTEDLILFLGVAGVALAGLLWWRSARAGAAAAATGYGNARALNGLPDIRGLIRTYSIPAGSALSPRDLPYFETDATGRSIMP